ncbi:MAG: S24/S26 family peptidase [Lachnospiraceae bacterium]|nr:S24/S26 family peptidase [Lachnospiraceae bacterium]
MEKEKIKIDELLKSGQTVAFRPQGYSMYPVIVPGRDYVVVAPVKAETLKRGDVAVYRRYGGECGPGGSKLVIHRVHRHKKDGIYMIGDSEFKVEGPLKHEQFYGIMTELYRKDKRISVRNPFYRFLTGTWLFMRPVRPVITKLVVWIKKPFRKNK